MSDITDNSQQVKGKKSLRDRVVPILMLLLVIAITAAAFFYRDRVAELGNYGYLSAFLISLVSNATIILPIPGFIILFALGATFNPILVGLAGALGGTIGEMTCYMLGYSGRGVIENRKLYDRSVRWLGKWGALTVFIFAVTPSPFDVIGMVAGLLRYPFWKFFLACLGGKAVKYTIMAFAGAWGWEQVLRWMAP